VPRQVIGRVLLVVILSVASVALLFPEWLDLGNSLPFVTVVSFRPAEAAGLVVAALLVVAVKREWWPQASAVGVIAALALGFVVTSRATSAPPTADSGPVLTLLSFNVYDGHADITALAREILRDRPDLVVLPEAGERYRERIMTKVGGLGYRSWTTARPGDEDVDGIVVLAASRLGALISTPLPVGAKFEWMQLTGGTLGDVSVIAVHTAAPIPGWTHEWAADMTHLRQWCTPGHGRHILVGDFNATLDHHLFQSSIAGCTDAAASQGKGLTATWPSYFPRWFGVQIDHVLGTSGLLPRDVQVLDLPGSDHRALRARMTVGRP